MEAEDLSLPLRPLLSPLSKMDQQQQQPGLVGAFSAGAFFHHYHHHPHGRAALGNSLSPSVPAIHVPSPLHHNPTQTLAILSNPNQNPNPVLNPNSNPNPNSPSLSPNYPTPDSGHPPASPPPAFSQVHMPSSSPAPPPGMGMGMGIGMGIAMAMPHMEPAKRKRGRPRKYGTDVSGVGSMALGLGPSHGPAVGLLPKEKKTKNTSRKAQLSALGASGQNFSPYVITVATGEDVAMKIMAFSQQGPWTVCILSANGAISNVSICQPAIPSGFVTYEGRYEILSLSGSFFLTESNGSGMRSQTGVMSISLAGADGRVLGGKVAGILMAATPVQVVVGAFLPDSPKSHARLLPMPASTVGIEHMQNMLQPGLTQLKGETNAAISLQRHHCHHEGGMADEETAQKSHAAIALQSMEWAGSNFDTTDTRCNADTTMSSAPPGTS